MILPLALFVGTADRRRDRAPDRTARALPAFAAALAALLAAALIVVRLSGGLPWGIGVKGMLVGVLVWARSRRARLWRVLRGGRWRRSRACSDVAGAGCDRRAAVFGTLLCLYERGVAGRRRRC